MHMMGALASEDSYVDVLACDMTENHASNDDLAEVREEFTDIAEVRKLLSTVGMARPYATFFISGPADDRAGDATSGPA